jgi:hypothetical protein
MIPRICPNGGIANLAHGQKQQDRNGDYAQSKSANQNDGPRRHPFFASSSRSIKVVVVRESSASGPIIIIVIVVVAPAWTIVTFVIVFAPARRPIGFIATASFQIVGPTFAILARSVFRHLVIVAFGSHGRALPIGKSK